MSTPLPKNVDTAILEAGIQVAGTHPANIFNTKEVASIAGISEFSVYERFKSKENLLNKIDEYIAADFYQQLTSIAPKAKNFEEFFSQWLDYQIAHPYRNAFSISYCRVFPRHELASDYRFWCQAAQGAIDYVLPFYPLKAEAKPHEVKLWCFWCQELFVDAQLLAEKRISDTSANRQIMAQSVEEGFVPFLKKEFRSDN
jgi:AcrR family transcriptional regulator